jgi:hypothetical protein
MAIVVMKDAVRGEPASSAEYNKVTENIRTNDGRLSVVETKNSDQDAWMTVHLDGTLNADASHAVINNRLDTLEGAFGAWQTMVLQNGWVARSGFQVPSYRTISGNRVQFTGTVIDGTNSNGTVVTNLALGYRPSHEVYMPIFVNSGYVLAVAIKTTGDVSIFRGTNTDSAWTAFTFSGEFQIST